jgi:hypothetical protein
MGQMTCSENSHLITSGHEHSTRMTLLKAFSLVFQLTYRGENEKPRAGTIERITLISSSFIGESMQKLNLDALM